MPRRLLLLASLAAVIASVFPAVAIAAPSALTEPASSVHHTTAMLVGKLNPDIDPGIVNCEFEWGSTEAYGETVPCNEGDSFTSPATVSASLAGLTPGDTYHFRLRIETTSSGTVIAADRSFSTVPFVTTRPLIGTFGPDGTPASSFQENFYVKINHQNGHLFVLDRAAQGIYGFDGSSQPVFTPLGGFTPFAIPEPGDQPDIAVDSTALSSSGNLYYVSHNADLDYAVYGYDSAGAPLPGFPIATSTGQACGAAVDSSGHLWLANQGVGGPKNSTLEEFNANGVMLGSVDIGTDPSNVCKLAFDSNDDLYVVAQNGQVWKYTATSDYTSGFEFASGSVSAVAVDGVTHNVYISNFLNNRYPYGIRVEEYDASGQLLAEFSAGENDATLTVTRGLDIDPVSNNVYVSSAKKTLIYGDEITNVAPTATTESPSDLLATSATLSGAVDPEGAPVTDCHIEWGTTNRYGNSLPCDTNPGSGSGDVQVSAQLDGLVSGTQYHYRIFATSAGGGLGWGDNVTFTTRIPPTVKSPSATNITEVAADLGAFISPVEGDLSYRFEWGTTLAYGNNVPIPDAEIPAGLTDVAVTAHLSGLAANTTYHWRIVAHNAYGVTETQDASFATVGPPIVETVGAPVRSATTADLGGRVDPRGAATIYHFEYGGNGPCSTNPCQSTPPMPAGSGSAIEFISERIEGLQPSSTYHYRIVAENGRPGGPSVGEDRTLATRTSDLPLSHGHFPGPPGSDRAYEQVSIPDSSGNPATRTSARFTEDGEKVIYTINGGSPLTEVGRSGGSPLLAERPLGAHPRSGWVQKQIFPSRAELSDIAYIGLGYTDATQDLTSVLGSVTSAYSPSFSIWDLSLLGTASRLFQSDPSQAVSISGLSADGSRKILGLRGGIADPAYPGAGAVVNLYDIGSGSPALASVLPTGAPACVAQTPSLTGASMPSNDAPWISTDGSLLFFGNRGDATTCSGPLQLYMRDLDVGQSTLISGTPLSGPACDSYLLRTTDEAAFFATQTRLDAEDVNPLICNSESQSRDVYRYRLVDGNLECLTCVPGKEADIYLTPGSPALATSAEEEIGVAADGSRVYFRTSTNLLSGAPADGQPAIYRLDVASQELAYVAPLGSINQGVLLGRRESGQGPLSGDGSVLIFRSTGEALNPLGEGTDNSGTFQYYRYDDDDRSLVCISCPPDGSAPTRDVTVNGAVSQNGAAAAFATATALVGADQNTSTVNSGRPGEDIYEWRDGRTLLVTDGLTSWPVETSLVEGPTLSGLSASGRDLYFDAPAQYTPDALDGYRRVYDARIGGGIDFPDPPRPCPLEVCQGTPKGAPEEAAPGTGAFSGPGNVQKVASRCRKGKVRRKGRCVAKRPYRRAANHNRRAHR
jgi:hypothetical protein